MQDHTKNTDPCTEIVEVGNVKIGGHYPIVIQSMTDTKASDIENTVLQVIELVDAGAEIVRIAISDVDDAHAVAKIKTSLLSKGYQTPIVGCFHYNGHDLLVQVPECAQYLDKYRINPGNMGFTESLRDRNFETCIKCAIKYHKPIRIGVNWGSIDQKLLAKMIDHNKSLHQPKPYHLLMRDIMVHSALNSAKFAEQVGLPSNKIIISAKSSNVEDLIAIYVALRELCQYPLHVGLTEAGPGTYGIVSTSIALGNLLCRGIGNTIRASLTLSTSERRSSEVIICKQILQSLGLRTFSPTIIACPGCGRTDSAIHRYSVEAVSRYVAQAMPVWKKLYKHNIDDISRLKIAVMGCVVNGPGESKHADIGMSMPGCSEQPYAMVFIEGKYFSTIVDADIVPRFQQMLEEYIRKKFSRE